MFDVLMFPVARPADAGAPAGPGGGESKIALPGTTPPETTTNAAFDISSAAWSQLRQLISQANGSAQQINADIGTIAVAGMFNHAQNDSHIGALTSAWQTFAAQLDGWTAQTEPALKAAAADLVSFGNDVAPAGYGPVISMLKAVGAEPLTPQQAQICADALSTMAAAAQTRAQVAAQASSQLGPFVQALSSLQTTFAQTERNPPVQVSLPDCGAICLSYGDDGLACAGDSSRDDPRHHWVVTPLPSGSGWSLTANDGRMLVFEFGDYIVLGMRMPATGRPSLVPASSATANGLPLPNATFNVPMAGQKGLIQNQSNLRFTLDCSGDDGWQDGTPVLIWSVNDGPNQHWQCEPPAWIVGKLRFYDAVAPIAGATLSLSALQQLEGDWQAVANDLNATIAEAKASVDTQVPFVGALQVQQVLTAWGNLANEAQAAAAGLDPASSGAGPSSPSFDPGQLVSGVRLGFG